MDQVICGFLLESRAYYSVWLRVGGLIMRLFRFAGLAAVAMFGFTSVASAAPPPLVYNWTGFYIGGNAGGIFAHNAATETDATTGLAIASFTMSPAGFAGGGQAGYNYQFAPNWVAGLEGDFQGTTQSASSCAGAGCANPGSAFYFTEDQKLKWFATLRARLGYANGDWLFYVTGGGAWAEVHNDFLVFTPADAEGSADFNLSGWAIGGGVETHLGGRWSAKLEYLYLDLGSYTDIIPDPLSHHTFTMTSNVRDNVVRVGLNYKFY
jgi:outer membrane immunogenic protein